MFDYQEKERFFAQTQRGLEQVALEELEELGAIKCSESFCGVYFQASHEELYRINYMARTLSRVLAPLVSFTCNSEQALYKKAYDFPWPELFSVEKTFAVKATVSNSRLNHSQYAALRLKDAVVDHFRDKCGKRPDVDPENPTILLNLNIRENRALISLDTSGQSLHRRSYRVDTVSTPLQETLAAAIIRLSGWNGDRPFIDPMCGSGTFLAEALMHYCHIPTGFKRKHMDYGFVQLPDFDRNIWNGVKREEDKKIRPCPEGLIRGSDVDPQAVKAARRNLNQIPGGNEIIVSRSDFRNLTETKGHMIVTNPPYGIRVGEKEPLFDLYKEFGDFLKQQCNGSTAFILCGDIELTKHIGLKISRRIPLYNGPIEARLIKIDLY